MTFTELDTPDALTEFINSNETCIVTFSATWCGPCKRSKPDLIELAKSSPLPIGYVYESDLDEDDFFNTFQNVFLTSPITGFPTYICFQKGGEVQRINGSKWEEFKEMAEKYSPQS